MTVATEIVSRNSRNERVKALFLSKPAKWISVKELAKVGGYCSWRTRVSEVRVQLEADDQGTLQWNGDVKDSRYRYLKHMPLGPDAAVPRERFKQPSLFKRGSSHAALRKSAAREIRDLFSDAVE